MKSLMQAGKVWQPANSENEKRVSRALGLIGLAFSIYLLKFLFTETYISDITRLRAVIIIPLLLFVIIKFFKGVSISWMLRGLLRHWIPTLMFLILYSCFAAIFYMIFTDNLIEEISISLSGVAMLSLAVVFYSYFVGEANASRQKIVEEKLLSKTISTEQKIQRTYFLFMKFLWIGFIFGGIFALLYAIGVADWFVAEALGW